MQEPPLTRLIWVVYNTLAQFLAQYQPGHGLRLMLTEMYDHDIIIEKWWTFKELLEAMNK